MVAASPQSGDLFRPHDESFSDRRDETRPNEKGDWSAPFGLNPVPLFSAARLRQESPVAWSV
jgi:hypothetical protein